ncbi:MAG: restriction endonuclease [Rhodocyclales bacterium GT-UBC]|nr:MAG: restriction endonuclease [Rhodocyclales bacterium GT-UBC]
MPSRLFKYRHLAFVAQNERCYYCGFLMWESAPESFAKTHKISLSQAQRFKCTAEHLEARQDGGTDAKSNVVAACLHCNQTRHRIRPAPSPSALKAQIAKQLKNNGWHKKKVADRLSNHPSA